MIALARISGGYKSASSAGVMVEKEASPIPTPAREMRKVSRLMAKNAEEAAMDQQITPT